MQRVIFGQFSLKKNYNVRNRLFLQQLWHLKYDWDETFQKNEVLINWWKGLINDTHKIAVKQFRRQIAVESNTEIHVFGDASKEAYGAVVYVRTRQI